MKVDEHRRLHQSTAGEGIKLSIDPTAFHHLMEILTKLYANPLLAVIREYSTNAWDSHRMAGVTRPIEVTLPTALAPTLTITDHGLGLDGQDIEDIYSKYGASTKRDTNEAVGQLGVGCKSALSYTSQFTVEGRKDGQRIAVLVSRDEDGAGSMTPVADEPTTEPDGVTVTIPIKASDIHEATSLAYKFFRFWPKDDVLVNGKPVPNAFDLGGIWLTDDILLTNHEDITEDLVVMGNVPYPLVEGVTPLFNSNRAYHGAGYRKTWNAVCFVPIGAVNFAPSRENLMTTRRTTHTLDALREKVQREFERSITEQIANAKSAKEAQELLINGRSMGYKGTPLYKGREVVLKLRREAPTITIKDYAGNDTQVAAPGFSGYPDEWTVENALAHSFLHANATYYARKTGDRSLEVDLREDGQWIFANFDGKSLTNVKRAKLELWFQQNAAKHVTTGYDGVKLPHCVFVDKLSADEKFWTKGWPVHDWNDVAAIELPKVVQADGTSTRLKGSYDAVIAGTTESGVPAARIAQEAKKLDLYWIHGNTWAGRRHRAFKTSALDARKSIVVCLGANRIDKFCRDFPAAKKLDTAAKEAAERWVKKQTAETRKAYSVQRRCNVEVLKTLDVTTLDDPELRELHALAKMDVSTYVSDRQAFAYWVSDTDDDKAEAWADKVLAGYPLYNSIGRYDRPDKTHVVLYLNAAYAARQKGGN